MNLKRIRIDPQGLLIQTREGVLERIQLKPGEIKDAVIDIAQLRRHLPSQFVKNGNIDAKIDSDLTETDFLNRPLRIYYGIEPRCNIACAYYGPRDFHAIQSKSDKKYESFLLRNFCDSGAFQVQLTGGEVGLRGFELVETIQQTADLGLAVILATNGVWNCIEDKDAFISELAMCGNIIQSKISIDGTKQFHERMRGTGTYDPAIETLSKLSQHGMNPRINATIFRSSCNAEQLTHLVGLAEKFGAALQLVPVRPAGRAKEIRQEMPHQEQLNDYTKLATELRKKTGTPISFNFDIIEPDHNVPVFDLKSPISCGAPLMGHHVTHAGECFPCGFAQEFSELSSGTIGPERSYLDIWRESSVLLKIRKAGKSQKCRHCQHYGFACWGVCWIMSYTETGKPDMPDPYCFYDGSEYNL